jgi:alkanesulfonate monooxygenase SsuD/methylene tetrahydromethanopterin reductase-like flavin-dependent oxidoreductase (luciferase family)
MRERRGGVHPRADHGARAGPCHATLGPCPGAPAERPVRDAPTPSSTLWTSLLFPATTPTATIAHPTITDRYLEDVARPAIARGAEKTGRSPADVTLKGVLICSIADDPEQARREAAAQIAFYVAPRSYGPVMEASGFGEEAAAIQTAFRAQDHDAMVAAVSPAMLDEMAAAGTVEDVRDQVARLEQRYDHAALYSPSFTLAAERVRENTFALVEAFARPAGPA